MMSNKQKSSFCFPISPVVLILFYLFIYLFIYLFTVCQERREREEGVGGGGLHSVACDNVVEVEFVEICQWFFHG